METFYEAKPKLLQKSAIALGFFDGVHRGHQVVIGKALAESRRLHCPAAVITFKDHPRLLTRGSSPMLLSVIEQRLELFGNMAVDVALVLSFTEEFCRLSPRQYVEQVLVQSMGACSISVGHNHHFGRDREGDTHLLTELGRHFGFSVHVAPMVLAGDVEVSSSKVRELVVEGDVASAARLLGRPFAIYGEVVAGAARGQKLGFPTANLKLYEFQCLPKPGVYAGHVQLPAGASHTCVINIGYRPTFTNDLPENDIDAPPRPLVEVHILGFTGNLYGQHLTLDFLKYLRPELKFENVEGLVKQIRSDCQAAGEYVHSRSEGHKTQAAHELLA